MLRKFHTFAMFFLSLVAGYTSCGQTMLGANPQMWRSLRRCSHLHHRGRGRTGLGRIGPKKTTDDSSELRKTYSAYNMVCFYHQIRRADKDLRGPKNLVQVVNDQLNPYHRQRHCLQPLRPVWSGIPDNATFPQIGRFNHQKVTPLLATIFGLNLPGFSEDKILRRLTVLWPSNMCIVCGGTP